MKLVTRRARKRLAGLLVGGAAVIAMALTLVVAPVATPAAQALSGSDFNPGLIISDQIFFNANSMTANDIQYFINTKYTGCRAGYTCLRDYHQDTYTIPRDPMCTTITGKANQSAAQIIYDVAQACGISPQVILVTLQKEQGLVTSTAPSSGAYRSAMGAGCPDTAACDSNYYGFFNQVHYGAYLMKRYTQPAGTGPGTAYYSDFAAAYRVGSTVAVKYSPNCAGPAVTIQNMATHVLYVYTPYQPEPAVLANLTGSVPGDICAAYGNRNFWVYFNNWFGSTVIPTGTQSFITAAYSDILSRTPGPDEVNYWVNATLHGSSRLDIAGSFNNSDEYRLARIDEAYRNVLAREPDAAGRQWWLNSMRAGALQSDDVSRYFYSAQEYFDKVGGTDTAYIDALYLAIVGRPAEAAGLVYWDKVLVEQGRAALVDYLWFSTESYYSRVTQAYQSLLGRDPADTDKPYWTAFAQRHGYTAMRIQIMGSQEYLNRAIARFPNA